MEIKFGDKKIDLDLDHISVEKLLNNLEINPVEVVVTQNGQVVLESSILKQEDEIKIIQVIHGG
jgi:sulfur carrier protein